MQENGTKILEEQMQTQQENNKTMMQYFEWYLPSDHSLWRKVKMRQQSLDRMESQQYGCHLHIKVPVE